MNKYLINILYPYLKCCNLKALLFFAVLLLPTYSYGIIGKATVIDGDTIEIRGSKIRLWGIDAFESTQKCKDYSRFYSCGSKAAWELDRLIGNKTTNCKSKGKDRYQRTLAICFSNNINLNEAMVLSGWALAYSKYSSQYEKHQLIAATNKRGAWSGSFVAPWDFRSKRNIEYSIISNSLLQDNVLPFESCKQARLHNGYTIRKGDPRYSAKLDRDNDGIACE
jgi:endonuclease YncB( thermonuclease family)